MNKNHSKNLKGKDGEPLGENIYFTRKFVGYSNGSVSNEWYDEKDNYDFQKGKPKDKDYDFEHFTQIVWKNSKKVGFGIYSKEKFFIFVANYSPKGNNKNEFLKNVENKSN